MDKIILTGDRPTGRLHVGHYVGSLRRRVELQNSGEFDKILESKGAINNAATSKDFTHYYITIPSKHFEK